MKNEVKNVIITTIVVILIIVIVYFITAVFMTGEIGNKSSTQTNEETTKNYTHEYDDMIIAGRVFNQNEDNYKVIIYSSDTSSDAIKNAISSYTNETKLYKVNVDEAINSYVISETENSLPANSSELKVKEIALITIQNGTVSSYISDEEQIINALK